MQQDWITMATLGTFGGVVMVVSLVCQYLKDYVDQALKLPTRLLVLIVSWLVLFGREYVMTGGVSFQNAFLDLINGFLVALAAMGVHSVAKDNFNWK